MAYGKVGAKKYFKKSGKTLAELNPWIEAVITFLICGDPLKH